jgi:hypothetical protein
LSAQGQTADDLVDKHIAAIGGKDLLNSIKSQIVESTISVMGNELPAVTTVLVGKGFKNVANFNGQEIIQVVTPTGGWMINPLQGITTAEPLPEDQVKAGQSSFQVGGELFNYKDKGSKVELAGTEKIEGKTAYKLNLTNKENKLTTFWLDSATNYIVKRESSANIQGQDVTVVSTFSNHKKTDIGMVIPYSWTTTQGFDLAFTITKVTFNSEIDPKIFEMPKN